MSEQLSKKIQSLKEKQEVLQAQIHKLESTHAEKEKKRDMRRKILIGAFFWTEAQKDPQKMAELKAHMDSFLTRETDRTLFELSERE